MKLDLNSDLGGTVAIVGAGPSDPELMTLRAVRLLAHADVVLVDRLVDRRVLGFCPSARIIDVGKNPAGRATSQDVINGLLVKEAQNGNFVVRLKGGDPFVLGRGGEEAIELAKNAIDFEVVPGVSSCVAAPSSAGIPVTHRGVSTHFSVVSGYAADGVESLRPTWEALARAQGTLVFLMGITHLSTITEAVLAGGRRSDTPCAVIQEGTTTTQVVLETTLGVLAHDVRRAGIASPATVVIGEVVALRREIGATQSFEIPHQEVG